MRSLRALGLVLVIVGGLLVLGVPGFRTVGYALIVVGAGLVVFSYSRRPRRARKTRKPPYTWEDDEPPAPPELYEPSPGEVQPRPRPALAQPEFTAPEPGSIPQPRGPASGGEAQYTTGPAEVPEPRQRTHGAVEYSPPPAPAGGPAAAPAQPARPPLGEELPAHYDDAHPPMAPPPRD